MTILEVIDRVDELSPNQYTEEQKISWLSDFDAKVFHEVFMTHEPKCCVMYPFQTYEKGEQELVIPSPYAADVYVNYLLSRIAEANAEIQKYNLYATLFNQAYSTFTAWFNRQHMPKEEGGWRF